MARKMTKREAASVSWRPTVAGSHYAVSSGHYLATAAAMRVLDAGGNAVDAGVTATMALAVLQPDVVSFAGVAPTLVYLKAENLVISLAGLGPWPAATDVARLRAAGGKSVPEGILRQVIPAAPATHVEALRRFGTLSFEQAVKPAYELARDGFYMYPELRDSLEIHGAEIDRYAENARIFRPGGRTPAVGERLKQPSLARTLERMIEAERKARGDRAAKLRAVQLPELVRAQRLLSGPSLHREPLSARDHRRAGEARPRRRGVAGEVVEHGLGVRHPARCVDRHAARRRRSAAAGICARVVMCATVRSAVIFKQ